MRGESTCCPASPPRSCFGSLVGDKKEQQGTCNMKKLLLVTTATA
jgi:hypothetical protein